MITTTGLTIREIKDKTLTVALARTGGNQAAVARLLGISHRNISFRINKRLKHEDLDDNHFQRRFLRKM